MSAKDYVVPAGEEQFEYEVKKSRFIACSSPTSNRAEAMAFLERLKLAYPDARHYCWAYLLGNPLSASSAAMSDDGEPSGTAGKPILHVIQHKKIGDIMVVVVRYFGGIKLGAGGLTRAYSSATQQLLSTIQLVEHVPMQALHVRFDFHQESQLRHWLSANEGDVVDIEYQSSQVHASIHLPIAGVAAFLDFCQARQMVCVDSL